MFTHNLRRSAFFWYSAASQVLEIALVVMSIVMTIGFEGLLESKPGPGREGLALAILVTGLLVALMRSNLALRRTRDSGGSKWTLGFYIVFSLIFAVLQAAEMLVFDFASDDNGAGLGLVGMSLATFWTLIWRAKSAGADGGSPSAQAAGRRFEKAGEAAPSGLLALSDADLVARVNALRAADASTSGARQPSGFPIGGAPSPAPQGNGRFSGGGFGKRGLA